ncbi:MAG: hypothetical protein Roseis2KO_39200 [Roseivirga sp.]
MAKRILFNTGALLLLCFFFNTSLVAFAHNAGNEVTVNNTVNETCAGNNDGSVDLTITGLGNSTVVTVVITDNSTSNQEVGNWNVTSGIATGTFNDLVPGTYEVQFLASNSTTHTFPLTEFTIEPGGAQISLVETPISCNGDTNGSVTVNATGGVAPYEYSIDNARFQTVNVFGSLAAGSYTFQVKDATGCITSETLTLNEPDAVTISILTLTPPTCNGGSNGWIAVQAAGGDGNYEYSFDGGTTFSTAASLTNLSAGNYSIVIRDGNGCSFSQTPTLTEPTIVTSSLVGSTDATCFNQSDGTVTLDASGGTGAYSVWFQNTTTGGGFLRSFTPNSPVTGIEPGTYTLQVNDANGCLDPTTFSVTIAEPTALEASSTISTGVTSVGSTLQTIICSGSTADITVSATGGTTPYEYSIDGGTTFSANPTFTALSDGQYNIVVRDANGCTDSQALDRTILTSSPVAFSANLTDVGCIGGNDGAITVFSVTGGASVNRTYSLDGTNFQNSPTFTNLTAGNYTVTVLDQGGCVGTNTYTINEPAAVTVTANVTDILCWGDSEGRIEVSVTGATAPITYQLDSDPVQTSNIFEELEAGTYTLTVTEGANNCTHTSTVTVSEPPILTASVTVTDITCNGAADGGFELVITGGTAPYEASNGGTSFVPVSAIQSFPVGTESTFNPVVRDANGCTFNVPTFTVNEPDAITATFTEIAPCPEDSNGQIIIAAIGGTAPYMYKLGSGNFQSSDTFTGLSSGAQTIEIEDANGCTATFTATVPDATPITATLVTTDVQCLGDGNGTITVTGIMGGTAPYEYSIDGGTNFQTSDTFNNLAPGSYDITVRDAAQCSSASLSGVISEPATALSFTVDASTDALCNGGSDGSVTISVTGGVAPYTYNDALLGSTVAITGTTATIPGLPAGVRDMQNFSITDANGCEVTGNFTINEPSPLTIVVDSRTNITCNGANDGTVTFLASGGTGSYEYSLDGVNFQASNIFENLSASSTRRGFVRDANGCTAQSATFPVFNPNTVVTGVTIDADVTNCGNPDGALTVTASGHFVATNFEFSIDGGGTYQSSGAFTGLAAGTYNIVVRTEFGTCEQTLTATIADAPAITADVTTTNTTSCGVADGTITVSNETNGTGPYSYSLGGGTPQSSPVFTGLASGVYFVVVKDANGCESQQLVATISEPSGITADLSIVSLTCPDELIGSITVNNVMGGTAPYEYSFDGGSSFSASNTATGLDSDIYEVVVRDAGSCRLVLSADVTGPDNLTWARSVQNATCNGGNDGEINITASGGTGTLRYSLDGTNFQTSPDFTGLAAGSYTVFVTDDNNCDLAQITASVSEPAAIMASITGTTNVTCNGGDDGTATIAVSGGTAPYEVSIDGTQFFPVPPGGVFTNISAIDIPTILVRDANGCEISINGFAITEPNPIELEATPEAVSCFGDTNGAIDVSASSDSGNPFEFSLDGTNFVSTARFDNLAPGVYTVTALETVTMCTTTAQVTVEEPDVLVLNATAIDINCNGADDGQIKVESTGGTAPFEYSLDGTNFQTTDFTGLAAGSYTVTVRDVNQCTANANYTIAEPTALSATFTTTDAVCNGEANGSITIDISGGTAPYSWSDPLTFMDPQAITGTTATFDAIGGSRMNQAAVIDANGCEFTIDFTISEPDAIVGTVNAVTNVTCNGAADGGFTVTAMGGTGLFTYSIDGTNFSATNTFSGLAAGTYTVSIQDESNCIVTLTQAITEPTALALQFESLDISCNGAGDGQIAGIASGGTAPYTYSIDGTSFQFTAFTGLAAGSYTLTVKDANDCSATTSVTIAEPDVLGSTITSTIDVDCNGNSTGSAVLAVSGGSTPYSYSLDGSTFDTSVDLTSLSAGAYTVTIRDANSCETTTSFTITEPDVLGVSLDMVSDASCNGATDGSITVTGAGGTAPYQYAIDGTTFGTADTFGSLAAGSYTVTLQDANGCTATVAATVDEPTAITLSFTTTDISCNGATDGEITPATTGGTAPYEYSLDGTNFQSGAFTGQAAGTYTLTVRDGNGCTETASVTITEPVALSGTVAVTDVLCFGDADGSITISAAGGTAPYEYSTDGSTFQSGDSFSALAAGSYTITVRDANNCTVTLAATIAEPAELTVSANVINDNTISVTASGGTAPYEYALDNGTFQAASTFSGLANGDYSITVRDANGCTVSTSSSLVITGEDDPFVPVTINAYPNPVSDYLTFSRLAAGDQIRLVSLNGNSLDLTLIRDDKVEYRKDISGIRQKVFLAIVVSKDGRVKLNKKVMKKE